MLFLNIKIIEESRGKINRPGQVVQNVHRNRWIFSKDLFVKEDIIAL